MTKCDVKNYLEKIYNIPVGAVRTRIQFGKYHCLTYRKLVHGWQGIYHKYYWIVIVFTLAQPTFGINMIVSTNSQCELFLDKFCRVLCHYTVPPLKDLCVNPSNIKMDPSGHCHISFQSGTSCCCQGSQLAGFGSSPIIIIFFKSKLIIRTKFLMNGKLEENKCYHTAVVKVLASWYAILRQC